MDKTETSVFSLAASSGLPVGLYFCIMSFCQMASVNSMSGNIVFMGMFLAFPFILYILMKRMVKTHPVYSRMMAIWVYGIYTVIFGTLICALFTACCIYFIYPDFLAAIADRHLTIINSYPRGTLSASTVSSFEDLATIYRHIPPMQFVAAMGWASAFYGCVISCPLAFFASRRFKTTQH